MKTPAAFLSLIAALAVVASVVYINTGEVRATDPFFNDQVKCIALFHKATILDGASGEVVVADFVESPEQIPYIILQSTDTYHLTREYLDTVSNTCLK